MWILVGGNGAGKSTFYRLYLQGLGFPFVNADVLARIAFPDSPEESSYQAALLAQDQRERLLLEGASFCFETVFSHPSKIDFVARAKSLGYQVVMVFIHLCHPALNHARIQMRQMEGGHSVPREKVDQRIPRLLANVKNALPLCDVFRAYDNSSADFPFQPVFSLNDAVLQLHINPLPDWADDLTVDYR